MKYTRLVVKAVAFATAAVVLTGLLVVVFGSVSLQSTTSYRAIFTDVSGMKSGSDVRAAGVDIGRVDSLSRLPDNTIAVSFSVQNDIPLTTGTTATIRYQNLVGDRFLQLGPGPGPALRPGATIPAAQTHPALDLDELFNGFTPLFQGLQPAQLNQLSGALIAVLQGQGGAVDTLLDNLGSVTTTLADHSALISAVVDQLNTVLSTLVKDAPELNDTIVSLQTLVSGLAADRDQIGRSLGGINDLTGSLSDLLTRNRPDIAGTITQVGRFAQTVGLEQSALDNLIRRLPGYYVPLGRLGENESAFQFYLCGVQLRITTPAGQIETPFIDSGDIPRC